MRIVLLVLLFAVPAWAITPEEQSTIVECYQSDALVRGKDQPAMIQELFNFIFLTRTQQKNQLANTMQRCRDRITAAETTYDAETALRKSNLTASGTATDGALNAIPTLP